MNPRALAQAFHDAATMKNLSGGHGEGCNFEDEDRFSNLRRWLHQATAYGFILCFLATSLIRPLIKVLVPCWSRVGAQILNFIILDSCILIILCKLIEVLL